MIELRADQSKFSISPTVWTMSLELARLCGWQPAGPSGPADPSGAVSLSGDLLSWQTRYLASDGQTIASADAHAAADALERCIGQISKVVTDWQEGRIALDRPLRTPPTGFRWFTTAAGEEHLRSLAAFLRRGPIQIC
jgi:hypothetical protein